VRNLIKTILKEEVTAKDVHDAADEAGIPWDNDKKFMKLSKKVTGKEHIDDMTSKERKKLIKTILKEETMDHPFLGPNYYPGEEFFQSSKEQLEQIIDRLMKESRPLDDEDDQSFFYGWQTMPPPHRSPDQFGARHYTILRNHLQDIYEIRNPREIDYIWDKYYRELLRKYAR